MALYIVLAISSKFAKLQAQGNHGQGKLMTQLYATARAESQVARRALLTLGQTTGIAVVDAQQATSQAVADCEETFAETSRVRWLAAGMRAQARLTRNVADRYASKTREVLS